MEKRADATLNAAEMEEQIGRSGLHSDPRSQEASRSMPLRATLREDNTLELPEDAPRLARTNTPLHVIDLGGGTFVVTETEPQIPQIASEFRGVLQEIGVTTDGLLENLYKELSQVPEEEQEKEEMSELIQEPFVLLVRANPEPHHSVVSLEPNDAIVQTNPS